MIAAVLLSYAGALLAQFGVVAPTPWTSLTGVSEEKLRPGLVGLGQLHPTELPVRWSSASSLDSQSVGLRVWLGDVEPDTDCVVAGQPGMMGRLHRGEDRIAFRPRLGFRPAQVYTACLSAPVGEGGVLERVWVERFGLDEVSVAVRHPRPRVVSVWPPAGSRIPANSLRFYVDFDQPMRAAAVDRAVQLLDAEGVAIADALVPIPEGLWDARSRRLTVTLHPGRIKQGVGPREVQGAALRAGDRVLLRVGEELRSQFGVGVASETFAYQVGPPDREPPDPVAWRVVSPKDWREALMLILDERLDPAILRRAVRVAEAKGSEWVPQTVDLLVVDQGRRVEVLPTVGGWRPGAYRIEVLSIVEDLAGNRPGRAFDAALDDDGMVGGERREPEWFPFPFEIVDSSDPD